MAFQRVGYEGHQPVLRGRRDADDRGRPLRVQRQDPNQEGPGGRWRAGRAAWTVRYGAFVEPGVVVMPGYVNIGAYVASGTMVDTWATVGSGAQIGRDVHLAGGVGIGGVLEPPGAMPVVIEDGAFIGSRCIVVEGVRVEEEAVLGANVALTASTQIIDVTSPEEVIHKGRVPARSVVVAGTRTKQFPAGSYQLQSALIIGQRRESTDQKTSLNEALREFGVSV